MIERSEPRAAGVRSGRPAVTSHAELAHVALELFSSRGFDATTVDDIAAAAGIGRRTFFRYYSSKNDVVWGDFDAELDRMRRYLNERPADQPLLTALHDAVLDFNRFPDVEAPWHRRRMRLILEVPTLQAHSTLRYAAWREVVAEFVARRLDIAKDSMQPQAIAYAFLGVCIAAYEQWLKDDGTKLEEPLDTALTLLVSGLSCD
ncbi:MAG: mycofactocin system transcriptional regulator [Streptosporangiales bacterium]|nr:mycofactocin system transcriptional regulator [Streptosporangiales bacterium]